MTSLIVGSDGRLGSALMDIVPDPIGTTRRHHEPADARGRRLFFLDLLTWSPARYPDTPVPARAYLCAGTNGLRECEGNVGAFRQDVDGNIRLAKWLIAKGAFVLFVSSNSVEWGLGNAYARNRAMVEMALAMSPRVAIVRAEKFSRAGAVILSRFCRDIAEREADGVHHWSDQE